MYNHQEIEKKWQKKWRNSGIYKTGNDENRPKYYVLDMFPYPSGDGLHVGHPKGYSATDILARYKMMNGFNVLHPMGWDAFGLPAENYALKNKIHPRAAMEKNIAVFRQQLESLGFTYDWSRAVDTTDPEYYKWTQWAFVKMFERGLAYESFEPINWCPSCKTGLANEDLEDGKCERCGSTVFQKPLRQWVLKITDYAERLLNDLEKLPGWDESIKEMQRNWIGRSEGAVVDFRVAAGDAKAGAKAGSKKDAVIKVFTTRVDTIFGCTYIVIAPENKLLDEWKNKIENWDEVEKYREIMATKTTLERTDLNKDKTGVKLNGLKAVNPFNNEAVAIFIADYVLNNYGTGAVMAVPAHDERDYAFAAKYHLEIKPTVACLVKSAAAVSERPGMAPSFLPKKAGSVPEKPAIDCFVDDGILQDSGEYTGLKSAAARTAMTDWLEENKAGGRQVNYKLKDWVFSRQRYWGEPIPIIHCEKCGAVAVSEKDLPVILPEVESYEPTGTGESPLANILEWVNTTCPKCGGPGKRETNTMPQWAGSSWYYLRYIDPQNGAAPVDKKLEKYWSPVDFYVGGAEHATRHLIYARFWHKFLFDIGAVNYEEPFSKFKYVGLIMGEDGQKMSKRFGNVINPNEMVEKFGADALRLYEMFMGPFEQAAAWNTNGLVGARKFLERIYNLEIIAAEKTAAVAAGAASSESAGLKSLKNILHKTVKKVGDDINDFKFNTAISAMMILVNEIYGQNNGRIEAADFELLLKILAPFAPHLTEELWEKSGRNSSIFADSWPVYDPELIKDERINLVVQVNGKLRATIEVAADISEEDAKKIALAEDAVARWLENKAVINVIFVKGKLINIVIK